MVAIKKISGSFYVSEKLLDRIEFFYDVAAAASDLNWSLEGINLLVSRDLK